MTSLGQQIADEYIGVTLSNRYYIDAKFGEGGMGTVYRAVDIVLERNVAIKILVHNMQEDDTLIMRFLREARAAARIQHPHVVTLYDLGHLPSGCIYLVMEFIGGCTVRDLLNSDDLLNPQRAITLMTQVCRGVAAAHRVGVIHRDLKPENIMLHYAGPDELTAKVVDFGVARIQSARKNTMGIITPNSEILGTPNYMSPEQCLTSKIDTRSDIYSLGIIFYELLTGIVPFQGTFAAIMRQHMYSPIPPLRRLNPTVSTELEELLLEMLTKDKEERISLNGILKALNTMKGEPLKLPAKPAERDTESRSEAEKSRIDTLRKLLASEATPQKDVDVTLNHQHLPTRIYKESNKTVKLVES